MLTSPPEIQRKPTPPPSQAHYEPPPGFLPPHALSRPSTKVTKSLSASALAGKQLWHISLPRDMPLSKLRAIAPGALRKGHARIQHAGKEWTLKATGAGEKAKAVYVAGGREYRKAAAAVAASFRAVADPTPPPDAYVPKPRAYPAPLKVRAKVLFWDTDSEEEERSWSTGGERKVKAAAPAPEFRLPPADVLVQRSQEDPSAVAMPGPTPKRPRDEVGGVGLTNGANTGQSASKRRKKHPHAKRR